MEGLFSINNEVWVKPTAEGLKRLREIFANEYEQFVADESWVQAMDVWRPEQRIASHSTGGGWMAFELKELMRLFGPMMNYGCITMLEGGVICFSPMPQSATT